MSIFQWGPDHPLWPKPVQRAVGRVTQLLRDRHGNIETIVPPADRDAVSLIEGALVAFSETYGEGYVRGFREGAVEAVEQAAGPMFKQGVEQGVAAGVAYARAAPAPTGLSLSEEREPEHKPWVQPIEVLPLNRLGSR